MTLERASEIVREMNNSCLNRQAVYDLFGHFMELFRLDMEQARNFAEMCGFIMVEKPNMGPFDV